MLLLASEKGLWVEIVDAASSLGCFSAAVPTKDSLAMRLSNAARLLCRPTPLVTSNGERAVVSSVYDEVVHVQGDGRGLGVGGTVPGTGVLEPDTFVPIRPCFKIFNAVLETRSTVGQELMGTIAGETRTSVFLKHRS